MAYVCAVIFVETPSFTRRVKELLCDDDLRRLQAFLAENPTAGDVIEGTGGLRKIRAAMASRGKSAGARVIYYHFASLARIAMLMIYPKNERDNLTHDQRAALRQVVEHWRHPP
ncbi:type II toxin-antitoxin system RelE/ParE family toxin [Bacillus sp. NP157]|nr:type II toxin-antitoxin system RelE/ParE family toxin [Bacillus sp. NP157]